MKKYGFIKLGENDDIVLPCTWNLNVFNRIVDDVTNSVCIKTVADMVTGVSIKPNPFIFDVSDSINVKMPNKLTYAEIKFCSAEEVIKYLNELKSNPEKLKLYTEYVYAKKEEAEHKKQCNKMLSKDYNTFKVYTK